MDINKLSKNELKKRVEELESELHQKQKKNDDQKYESLFNSLTSAVALHEIILDKNNKPIDLIFLDVNPEYERITHLKASDIIGKRGLEVIPSMEQHWIDAYGKVALSGEPTTIIDHSEYLDKYWEVKVFSPQKYQFAVILTDITEKRKTEIELKNSEKRFRGIIESSPIAFLVYELNKKDELIFSGFNEAANNALETDCKKFMGKTIEEAFPPLAKTEIPGKYKLAAKEGKNWYTEQVNYDHKGISGAYEVYAFQISKGTVGIIFKDITEQKKAEQTIKKNIEAFKLGEEIASLGYYERNWQTGEGFWSAGFYKLLGVEEGEVECTHDVLSTFFHPDDRERVNNYVRKALLNKSEMNIEFDLVQKSGKIIHIRGNGNTKYNTEGKPLLTIGTFQDITDQKNAERELKNKNEEYLSLNEELNESLERIKLINLELEEAKEKAEESDRLKSAFLANMSHEIRTPMNGIVGFSEMFIREDIDKEKRNFYAKVVMDSSKQLLNIVNDILDISMIESNTIKLVKEEFVLNDLMNEIFAFYNPKFNTTDIKLYIGKGLKDEKSIIKTDRQRLRQVISNLMNNAIKFTNLGHIKLNYSLQNDHILFCVEDTGIGIAKNEQAKIFERFQQVDMESTRLYGGTGLGLSISKKLVELLGGKIWVESEKGQGSRFLFTIPYTADIKKKPITKSQPISKEDKTFTILVAEDEELNYLFIEETLSELDVKLIAAKNGKETVDIFKENPKIDLILMDIKMPIMDGYEATKQIKKLNPDIPIIAQTAYAMASDKAKAIKAGCDEYLAKPINSDELIETIHKYLNKAK